MRSCLALLAALVLISGLAGCGRLLGSRYDNFTAYYNTFYNAREAFERQERQLLNQERPVDRGRFLPLFPEPPEQAGRQEGFAKAVEKGADLLRDHPGSKWVDDALLLIGKAYFYQANFAGAEQKFREVIGLDESSLKDEAWLWLGRTLTASASYDEAARALRDGLGREGVRERWAAPMRLALAEVDVRRGDFEAAAEALRTGLDGVRDDEQGARAAFLLGQVYEALDRPADAADAYARALGFGPRYELAYAAQSASALALARAGETERALDLLRRMRRDDKNFPNLAEVELTRARVLAAAGQPDEARALLRTLLYDPDPALRAGAIRGPVHYHLAEVYRERLNDYARAAAHYDTAATAIRAPTDLAALLTPEAITDAQSRASAFGSYARVAGQIAEMDSLLYLGSLDDEAFGEAIERIRAQRRQEADAREREMARRRAEQGFRGGGPEGFDPTGDGRGTADAPLPPGAEGIGFLSFRNPVRVQEQLIGFQARWGDRPLAPNWRRAAAIGGGAAVGEDLAEIVEGMPGLPLNQPDALVDVSAVPRDPARIQAMRTSRAAARYELGNVLFLALGEPEAAVAWYQRVIEEDPEADVAPRAYFALAEAQRALGHEAEADALYRDVLESYPESVLADRVREHFGMDPRAPAAEPEASVEAEAAYALAYDQWQRGDYAEALDAMLTVSERYPTTPVAPRARLAAGTLYTEWAAGDSTALLAPLPRLSPPPDPAAPAAPPQPAPPETPLAPADSLAAPPLAADSLAAPPAADPYEDPWLYALYASIEEDYPGTPYAERARVVRAALTERYPRTDPAAAPADSLAGDAAADSLAGPPASSDLVTAGPSRGPGVEGLRGGTTIRADAGGYAWVLYSTASRLEAEPVVVALADLGYQAALYVERAGTITFHALVGQFGDAEEAEAARGALPSVRGAAEPYVLPLEGKQRWLQPPRALSRRNEQ
jgi:cellulose synthase operon protein C